MKAITCSQCGALIKGISLKKEIAVCNYCGAEMFLKKFEEKVIEIPDHLADKIQTQTNWEAYLKKREENSRRYAMTALPPVEAELGFSTYLLPIAIISIVIGLPMILYYSFNQSQPVKYAAFRMSSTVLYSDYLKAENLPKPEISRQDVTENQIEELKRLPLKEQTVTVKIEVNESGVVVSANSESQNRILRNLAEDSARKTKFYPPGKKLSGEIEYIFFEW